MRMVTNQSEKRKVFTTYLGRVMVSQHSIPGVGRHCLEMLIAHLLPYPTEYDYIVKSGQENLSCFNYCNKF